MFIGFPCSMVLSLFQFFSVFSFLNRFPLQLFLVPYSYLSTPLLVCFLVNQPHYHRFFSVFRFYKLSVLMRYTKLAGPVSF